MLLDALAMLADLRWRCLCVGSLERDSAFAETLRRRVLDGGLDGRVRFSGPQTGAELARSYRAADVLVLPSRGGDVRDGRHRGAGTRPAGHRRGGRRGAGGARATAPTAPGRGCWFRPTTRPRSATRSEPGSRTRPAPAVAPGGARTARVALPLVDDHIRRRRSPRGGGAMTAEAIRVSRGLARPARGCRRAARARELVGRLRRRLPSGAWVIHDLACGSGAMGGGSRHSCPGRSAGCCTTGTRTCSHSPRPTCPVRPRRAASPSRPGCPTSRSSAGRSRGRDPDHGVGAARPADGGRAGGG